MRLKNLATCLIFILLTGCNSSENVRETVAKIKQSTPASIEKLPDLTEYVPISYSASKSNDPFDTGSNQNISNKNSSVSVKKIETKRPDFERPREYLENFPLDTLVMVGILSRQKDTWALIVDRSGVLHKVKEGNYLGQNSGKIIKIDPEEIAIEEIVADDENGWIKRDASLKIKHQ